MIPRARQTELAGTRAAALLIRLAAPPVDDAANDALCAFLAQVLKVPPRAVRIVSGERSRSKRIAVEGLTVDGLKAVFAGRGIRL